MDQITIKTSTIFIAKGGKTYVYQSVEDVPLPWREQLEQSTNGFNSATILIADRRGREEIVRALNGMPTGLRTRLQSTLASTAERVAAVPRNGIRSVAHFFRRNWLEMLLPMIVGAGLWVVFNYR